MKNKFKVLIIFIALFTLVIFSNSTVFADTGPKPYVKIEIEGNVNGYYMTLLSKNDYYGPYSSEEAYNIEDDYIDMKFSSYVDGNGYYYLHYYKDISDKEFNWNYYPPSPFKILIYDSINDRFITDNKIYERTSFSTVLKIVMNEDSLLTNPFTVAKSNNYIGSVILGFVIRVCVCLIIEIIVAVLFRFKQKQLLVVAIANLFTQIILNLVLGIIIYKSGLNMLLIVPVYVLLEILIVIVEWLIYSLLINRVNKENYKSIGILLVYSIVANILSLGLGFLVLSLLGF